MTLYTHSLQLQININNNGNDHNHDGKLQVDATINI